MQELRLYTYIAIYAALVSGFFISTWAQSGGGSLLDMSLEDLLNMEVRVSGKVSQELSDVPATVYVVTEEIIETRGYTNLEELLEDIPGVEIQKKSAPEYNNHITFRGITGNEKFLILLDGFRINSTTGTPHAVAANYNLANIKQVEVTLGPASVLYQHAFSGVINIVTKQGSELNSTTVGSSFGSFTTSDNSVSFGRKFGNVSVAAIGNFYRSDEPNTPELYPGEFDFFHNEYQNGGQLRLSPLFSDVLVDAPILPYAAPTTAYSLAVRINTGNLEAGFSRNYESHSSGYGAQPDYYIYSEDNIYAISNQLFYAKHSYLTENKKTKFTTSVSKSDFELHPESKFVNTFTAYQDGFKYGFEKNFKFEEQVDFYFSDRHSLVSGLYLEDISALPKSGDLPFQYDPGRAPELQDLFYLGTNIQDSTGQDLTIFQSFFNLEYRNYGGFVRLQTRPVDALEFTLGARIDHNTNFGTHPNFRAGFVATPVEQVKFKLLYGEAFLPVSPYQSHQHYGAFIPTTEGGAVTGLVGPFWHLPNPDLGPEKLRSFETNLFIYPNRNLIISLDGYYSTARNLIVFEGRPNETFRGIPVDFAEFPVNRGETEVFGATAKVDVIANFDDGKGRFSGYGAYTYSDGETDGRVLAYSAKHAAKAGLSLKYGHFSIAPRMLFRSRSYHPSLLDENLDPLSSDPFTIINLHVRYANLFHSGTVKTAVFLNVRNLTDRRYHNVPLSGLEGFLTPQDPLRLIGGISFEL